MSGRLTPATVEAVKERADLLELVRADTELRKAGIEWVGRCPFHQERSGSFYVNPVKGLYHCYGCGVGGDVVAYVQARHALDFVGTIEWLAERFNVPLEYEEESPEIAARRRGEDRRRELLAQTAAFYHRVLRKSPLAEGARDVPDGARRHVGDGGALPARVLARRAAGHQGRAQQGLRRSRARRDRDHAAGPHRARSIAWPGASSSRSSTSAGGRSRSRAGACLPTSPARSTSNSPESPLWHKSSTLYGLHLARTAIAKAEEAIVVEGYTDVIGLVQAGYDNVVASMGTALTQQQLRELRKLARNVVLLFDADTAGSEAALRGLELAASPEIDLRVRVALPPRGSDPAEVAASGREAVDAMLGRAQSVLAFRVSLVLDGADSEHHRRSRAGVRGAAGRSPRRARDTRARRARAPRGVAPAAPAANRGRASRARRAIRAGARRGEQRPRVCAWTPHSETRGSCWRSRSPPGMPDRLC